MDVAEVINSMTKKELNEVERLAGKSLSADLTLDFLFALAFVVKKKNGELNGPEAKWQVFEEKTTLGDVKEYFDITDEVTD